MSGIAVGDIVISKITQGLRAKVLNMWKPENFTGKTYIEVQTVKKNNEPDKRYEKSWGGGSTEFWTKEIKENV